MKSLDYALRRGLLALMTIFFVLTFNFVLFRALPGNVVTDMSRVPNATPAFKHAIASQFGLDKPKWEQYFIYLRQLSEGHLGVSYANDQPVASNLRTDIVNTIPMVSLGTVVALVLGSVTGVIAAWRRRTAADHFSTGTALAFYSFPTQWLGLMLVLLFGAYLPTTGMHNPFLVNPSGWQSIQDALRHMILPSATVALTLYGQYTLIVRSAVLETLGEDYVLTARAKGLTPFNVLRRHVVPNAMLPIVTLVALSLGYIVGGAILIETVFTWPGIGLAVYQSVNERDYPMLQGAFLLLTVSIVLFNYLADLIYFKLDPRITE
jgi:ABC-type dipeptide/oligopeptide/nickel transport system permease component